MKRNWKKAIIAGVSAAVLLGGGGLWYYLGHNSSDPVYVYPFDFVGMTEYWGDTKESYGPVSTDRIQTVFLSETQTVSEILVSQGDEVKKGDLLLSFDTTLSDIQLERKRLEVEKVKLQLEDAQAELRRINAMKPIVIYENDYVPEYNPGTSIPRYYQPLVDAGMDGRSPENAIIYWMTTGQTLDPTLLEYLRNIAYELQNQNDEQDYINNYVFPDPTEPPEGGEESEGDEGGEGDEPTIPPYVPHDVNTFYLVIKMTSGDTTLADVITWQGLRVNLDASGSYNFRFFDASVVADATLQEREEVDTGPQIEYNSGYTASEIYEMKVKQQKTIKDLEFQSKMKEAEFKIMEKEVTDGNVYAQTDGVVISLITEDEAKMMQQPIMKVSGGGGFCVEGSVSELERDNLQIGQEVSISDWQTGMMYTGTVSEIRDFPTENRGYNGMDNPNASQYPFLVFVDESADLREGSYVSVSYSPSSSNGIYLQKPFLRTEKGISFVYVLGENGKLEQRNVTTGKSLWGSYTEILDGLTSEDKVAFPYGKNVKPGVKAVEGDLSNLYDY